MDENENSGIHETDHAVTEDAEKSVTEVKHTLEEKLHNILHELEAKLQSLFGSHPKIAEHIAEAHEQVASVTVNNTEPSGQ